jgi:hypothetical protein
MHKVGWQHGQPLRREGIQLGWPEPHIRCVYMVFLAGKSPNIYGRRRCICTVLANPVCNAFSKGGSCANMDHRCAQKHHSCAETITAILVYAALTFRNGQ